MRHESYMAFMEPSSIAIVGASDDGLKASGRTLRYLGKYGYEGAVYPVNPRRETVQGYRSYPSLEAVDAPIDLAVVVTPADRSLDAVASCVELQIPAVIMIPSGFAELDEEGAQRQAALADAVAGTGTRVLGPNCVGIVSVRSRLAATINTGMDQDRFDLRDGGIAFLTQSGAMGAFAFNMSQTKRVGLGSLISTGNEMDISFPEMLSALIEDPKVRGVLGYIEGIRDGDAFVSALSRARELGKPLGFLKVGRSDLGKEAIASHTGALAGSDAIYTGLFEQYGVTRITGIEALADWAQMIDSERVTKGNRLSIATTSGGGGVLVADHCTDLGIELARWEGEWRQRLGDALPGYASARNPIDMTGAGGNAKVLREVMELMVAHPETDIIMVLIGNLEREEQPLIETIAQVTATTEKPVVVVWVGGSGRPVVELNARGVPSYGDPARALEALSASIGVRDVPAPVDVTAPDADRAAAARAILAESTQAGQRVLDEHRAKQLLALYGMPVVREVVADGPDTAVQRAVELGFPVVLKVLAPNVAHKSELGGVAVDLSSPDEVRAAGKRMLASLPNDVASGARLLVQEMVPPGLELLLGIKRDEAFGPVLALGMGGVWTEVLSDIQLRLPPIGREDVLRAIDRLRFRPLLGGFRGAAPRDLEAVVEAVLALATLAEELRDDVAELDINPLIVAGEGGGARVVDAVVIPR